MSRIVIVASLAVATACGAHEGAHEERPRAQPTRIVALTIGSVDTLDMLGELGRVVAVEADCFVPGTEHMVKIKNDDHAGPSSALNIEAILALKPDLVIAKEELRPVLGERGLDVLWLPARSDLETVSRNVETIGQRIGALEQARACLSAMRTQIADIEARVAPLARVRVYYEAGRPGRTAGRGTIIDEMIRIAGGVNIAADVDLANPVLASEAILAADPEVIVLSPWSDAPDVVAQRPGWNRIAAVRDQRIHRIPEADRKVQSPSPRCVEACARELVPWLHPGLARPGAPVR